MTIPAKAAPLVMHFENSATAAIEPLDEMNARTHYYTSDRSQWRTDIPNYRRVLYRKVYPGIDVLFYGNDGQLEFDFILSPGADPDAIRLKFQGNEKIIWTDTGDLLLPAGAGELRVSAPRLYQEVRGRRKPIRGKFVAKDDATIGFAVDSYDPEEPLIIDPLLSYSTYADAGTTDRPSGIAVDAAGNIYISADAHTEDRSILTVRKLSPGGGTEYFVSLSGNALLRPTGAIAVDAAGNAYLTGGVEGFGDGAQDPRFPQVNPLQSGYRGNGDAILLKINPQGQLMFSTYLGGSAPDFGTGLAIDAENNVYVAGTTNAPGSLPSTDFPTRNPYRTSGGAFLTKINSTGTAILYSTYIDRVAGSGAAGSKVHVKVDSAGSIYAAGSDVTKGWLVKLNASGNSLLLSKDFAIDGELTIRDFALDSGANVYLATREQMRASAQPLGAIRKFDPTLQTAIYNIASPTIAGLAAIAVDPAGSVYMTGQAFPGFPAINSFALNAENDLFVVKLTPDGRDLVFSSFLNGTHVGEGAGSSEPKYARGIDIVVDSAGRAYVVGETNAANFPTTNGTGLSADPFSMQDTVVMVLDPTRTATTRLFSRLQESHSALKYAGSWPANSSPQARLNGGSARLAMDPGAKVSLTFTGTDIAWVSYRDEWSGIVKIYLDGTLVREVDTYATPPRIQVEEWINGLSSGSHTLTIEVAGRRNASSAGQWVWVDNFIVHSDGDAVFGEPTSPPPPPPPPPPDGGTGGTVRFEQNHSSVQLAGSWSTNRLALHSGGSAILSAGAGVRATFSFSGTSASWIAYRDAWSGIARVYVDGTFIREVDTYSASDRSQTVAHSVTGLPSGNHTLTIEVTGRRSPGSGGSWIWVDAFDATAAGTPPPPPSTSFTRVEQAALTATGTWFTHSHSSHSGGSSMLSATAVSRLSYTFSGSEVRWLGLRDAWSGIARVYVDGVLRAEVDTYSATTAFKAVLYSIGGLSNASHTITIEVAGRRSSSSNGNWVWVDALEYR